MKKLLTMLAALCLAASAGAEGLRTEGNTWTG